MSDIIEVTTTCACQDTARELARQLVATRLAACVQILGPIESHYRWQEQVQCEQEWICKVKSLKPLASRLIEFITSHHAYEVPEILIQPVLQSSQGYEQWLRTEVSCE
jgi:periplasmic divalent cation tolerance protein